MPRIANKDREELPKPQVKVGTLGFAPLNALTLSYRYHQVGDVVLGIPSQTASVVDKSVFKVQLAPKKTETLDIGTAQLKGLSDALYRGKLPQVLISTPSIEQLPALVNEVIDHVDKMLSLGFFLQANPADNLLPNIVIASHGVFFNRLVESLTRQLEKFDALSPQHRSALLGKFYRGFLDGLDQIQPDYLTLQEPVPLLPLPNKIKIAANNQVYRSAGSQNLEIIQSVLSLHGLVTVIENSVSNAPERLELEHAIVRSAQVILPALSLSQKETQSLREQVLNAIVRIGRQLMAFDEIERPSAERSKPIQPAALSTSDLTITDTLRGYAASLGLPEEKALFDDLNRQVREQLKP